jgi:hypothetical protein
MVGFKLTYLEWHFCQVGHGGKKTIWGVFLPKFSIKKVGISCTACFQHVIGDKGCNHGCQSLFFDMCHVTKCGHHLTSFTTIAHHGVCLSMEFGFCLPIEFGNAI